MKKILIFLISFVTVFVAMGTDAPINCVVQEKTILIEDDFYLVFRESSIMVFDSVPKKNLLLLLDKPEINYIAPVIASGERNLLEYMHQNMFLDYREVICGDTTFTTPQKVVLEFIITEEGKTEDIVITRSAEQLFNREAFRLVRELRFSSPAFLNKRPIEIKLRLPVIFDRRLICDANRNNNRNQP